MILGKETQKVRRQLYSCSVACGSYPVVLWTRTVCDNLTVAQNGVPW